MTRIALLLVALTACRRAPAPHPDEAVEAAALAEVAKRAPAEADRRARALLERARDPAAASAAVRQLARGGCARLGAALGALDTQARRLEGALFAGLVEDAREAAACPPAEAERAMDPRRGAASALFVAGLRADRPADALQALAGGPDTAARHTLRARLHLRLGQSGPARRELEAALALEDAPGTRAELARLRLAAGDAEGALATLGERRGEALDAVRVAALAAAGHVAEAARMVAAAPLPDRPALAREAARAARSLDALARAAEAAPGAMAALAEAIAERRVKDRGRVAALDDLRRAAAAGPEDAVAHAALAEALAEAGRVAEAVRAWDRAAALQPAAEPPRLAPIALLRASGRAAQARARAAALAASAGGDPDALALASAAAAAAGEPGRAVALAEAASAARPGDGRLRFQLAARLDEAGRAAAALDVYGHLLVCGAHGRPWHRHELVARIADLAARAHAAADARAALRPGCPPAAPDDLAPYLRELASRL